MPELITQLSQFAIMSVGYKYSLSVTSKILQICSPKYRNLTDSNQHYVTTNLNKSAVMLYIFMSFCMAFKKNPEYIFKSNMAVDVASQRHWKLLTMLFASTDLVSLLKSSKMPFSTKLHHYGVMAALGIILLSNFNGASLSKSLVIYGAFSSSAGIVNTYLGGRKLYEKDSIVIKSLKRLGLISYVMACSGNWTWQLKHLANYFKQPDSANILKFLLNTGLLYTWVQDDLKLMKHLATN